MKDCDPKKELSYLMYSYLNHLHGRAMSPKVPMNGFEWIKICLSLMKILQKTMIKKVMQDIFLKLMSKFSKQLHEL